MRKACVEPITFRKDGSIPEVEMTTQGAESPIDASLRVEAEQACVLSGNVRVSTGDEGGEILSGIRDGDQATYKYLDFKTAPRKLRLRVKPGKSDSSVNIFLDQIGKTPIAGIKIMGSPDGQWAEVICDVSNASGVHVVILNFQVQGNDGPILDWWKFE
jgi:arabinoxylan arabinofuranohydrolase